MTVSDESTEFGHAHGSIMSCDMKLTFNVACKPGTKTSLICISQITVIRNAQIKKIKDKQPL